jgi:formylglycine-generating enzyme required for sulfatase activity
MKKNSLKLLVILMGLATLVTKTGAQNAKISNIRIESNPLGQAIVSYDLSMPEGSKIRDLRLYILKGDKLERMIPQLVKGDVRGAATAGTNKKIIWDAAAENVKINESVRAEIHVEFDVKHDFESLPEMADVKGDTFLMGYDRGKKDELPVHKVALWDFQMSKYEVMRGLWNQIMSKPISGDCDDCPVSGVSYDEIQEFIARLNQRTGKTFRLPTEAEWEYAAKGGREGHRANEMYSGGHDIGPVSWFVGNSEKKLQPVGGKTPNRLGIYDMTGNVLEWCLDAYEDDFYGNKAKEVATNPVKKSNGRNPRVLRGGSFSHSPPDCTVTTRSFLSAGMQIPNAGFRLVLGTHVSAMQ